MRKSVKKRKITAFKKKVVKKTVKKESVGIGRNRTLKKVPRPVWVLKELNNKQRAFLTNYLKHFNISRAAKESGYSKSQAHLILQSPVAKAEIQKYMENYKSKVMASIQEVSLIALQRLKQRLFDVELDKKGFPLPHPRIAITKKVSNSEKEGAKEETIYNETDSGKDISIALRPLLSFRNAETILPTGNDNNSPGVSAEEALDRAEERILEIMKEETEESLKALEKNRDKIFEIIEEKGIKLDNETKNRIFEAMKED